MGTGYSTAITTFIYLGTFSISLFLMAVAVTFSKESKGIIKPIYNNSTVCFFMVILAVLVPCVLAGVRGDNVGADTKGYGILAFKNALDKDFVNYVLYKSEWAFYGAAYIISRITDNVSIWLGFIQLCTIGPVLYVSYKMRNNISMIMVLLAYLFKFYNYSLCIMRQSAACSFIILAIYFLQEKKKIRFVLFTAIAIGAHSTAFLGIIFYILVNIVQNNIHKANKTFKFALVIIIALTIAIVFLPNIARFLISQRVLPTYYIGHMRAFYGGGISRYGFFEASVRLILCFVLLGILKKNFNNLDRFQSIMIVSSIAGCIFYIVCCITWKINTAYRVTEYFDFSFVFSIALIPNYIRFNDRRLITLFLVVISCFVYWMIVYMVYPTGLGFLTEHFSFR